MWLDSLTDFSSPFTVYLYLAILIFVIRVVAVLKPLLTLFHKLSGSGVIGSLYKLRKDANLKGVWALVLQEVASSTAPALLAICLRYFLPMGGRQPVWTTPTTIGFILLMCLIIAVQLWDILNVRDFLNTLSGRMTTVIKHSVNVAVGTRKNLVLLANMSEPEFGLFKIRTEDEKQAVFRRDAVGTLTVNKGEVKARSFTLLRNMQTATYNVTQLSKGLTKRAAAKLRDSMDAQMQKQVDMMTRSYNPLKAFAANMIVALAPLLYIFSFMFR